MGLAGSGLRRLALISFVIGKSGKKRRIEKKWNEVRMCEIRFSMVYMILHQSK